MTSQGTPSPAKYSTAVLKGHGQLAHSGQSDSVSMKETHFYSPEWGTRQCLK